MSEPVYVYFIEGYLGPVKTTEVRPGLLFDTTPNNQLIGIEVLDCAKVTIGGRAAGTMVFACDCCPDGDHKRPWPVPA